MENMTFNQLLTTLQNIDDELVAVSFEEHKELAANLKDKIDALAFVKGNIESRIEYHKRIADEHADIKRKLERSLDRLKDYVKFAMNICESKKEIGDKYQIQIVETSKVATISEDAITPQLFAKYPDVIMRKFVFDKKAIKDDIEKYSEIAELEKNQSVRFSIKK
jgi:hypothetical protein